MDWVGPKSKWPAVAAVVAVAAALGVFVPRLLPVIGAGENRLADLRISTLSAPEPLHPQVIVLAITEATLAMLPYRSPFDRGVLASLVSKLDGAGARAIGIDILLDQPSEPAKDKMLFDALAAAGPKVTVAWAEESDGLTKRQTAFLGKLPATVRHGLVNLVSDPSDGTVRWIFPGRDTEEGPLWGFAHAITGVPPTDMESPKALRYRPAPEGKLAPFKTYPAHALRLMPGQWFKDKVVLIGADLPNDDRFRTPLAAGKGEDAGTLAGVVIHAHAVAQLLDGTKAPLADVATTWVTNLAMALIAALLLAARWSLWAKIPVSGALLAVYWVGGFAAYRFGGPLIALVGPTISFAAAGGLAAAHSLGRSRTQTRFIKDAFSRFTSPSVVEQMVADPSRLSLAGERREITCVFTDLAGFTSMIEKADPKTILPVLNRYLDGMCRIVFAHDGTIDKIVGDALHVMFGAPVDQPDHAERAVECAVALDRFARDFVAGEAGLGIDVGGTRIGVHTGEAVVGNFGGDLFFDYTAHGDVINTAARLESVNKHLGTDVCISGVTAERCKTRRFRPIGNLILKGKSQGVEAVTVVTNNTFLSPMNCYDEAYQAMCDGQGSARAQFEALHRQYPNDPLVALHAKRLAEGETGSTIALKEK